MGRRTEQGRAGRGRCVRQSGDRRADRKEGTGEGGRGRVRVRVRARAGVCSRPLPGKLPSPVIIPVRRIIFTQAETPCAQVTAPFVFSECSSRRSRLKKKSVLKCACRSTRVTCVCFLLLASGGTESSSSHEGTDHSTKKKPCHGHHNHWLSSRVAGTLRRIRKEYHASGVEIEFELHVRRIAGHVRHVASAGSEAPSWSRQGS